MEARAGDSFYLVERADDSMPWAPTGIARWSAEHREDSAHQIDIVCGLAREIATRIWLRGDAKA